MQAIREVLAASWADGTWSRKRTAWRQYAAFHERATGTAPDGVHDHVAVPFLANLAIQKGPVLARAYGSDLISIRARLTNVNLVTFVKALAVSNEPRRTTSRVGPMTAATAGCLVDHLQEPARSTLWLQWKTASRYDDLKDLEGTDFVRVNTTDVAVLFRKTKASHTAKYRPDHQVIVRHTPAIPGWLRLPERGQKMCPLSTNQYNDVLTRCARTAGNATVRVTAHSVKKGALSQLVERAAGVAGFPQWLVPLLAKHRVAASALPDVTVGYLWTPAGRVNIAQLLRTQEATVLLEPR